MRLLPRCKLSLNKCLPTGLAVSQIPWSMLIRNNQQKENRKILSVWKPRTALTTYREQELLEPQRVELLLATLTH